MRGLRRAITRARVGLPRGSRILASVVVGSVLVWPGGTVAESEAGTGWGQNATVARGVTLGNDWIALRPPASPVRVGKVVVFQLAVRFPRTTQPTAAGYVLALQGTWEAPWLVTPDNSEACGGDNIATLRRRSAHRWSLDFGDCRQLGVATWAIRAGAHGVSVEVYRIPVDRAGHLLRARATLMPRATVQWHAVVK